ncbi:MAG TPA: AraC family transcriptional regulator [Chitinophagaceae bacterium]|nr:AraC family transcriptional regulator [Chitinophagaceae bacterium]
MAYAADIYERMVSAKVYIDKNFDSNIDLAGISRQACLSPYHFHRLFTTIYRKTPHQYLTWKRLEKARLLLEKEGISVTEVCNSVGFESLSSFSLLFKRESGYAPQYYRNIAYLKKKLAKEQPKRFIPHCYIETFKLG